VREQAGVKLIVIALSQHGSGPPTRPESIEKRILKVCFQMQYISGWIYFTANQRPTANIKEPSTNETRAVSMVVVSVVRL